VVELLTFFTPPLTWTKKRHILMLWAELRIA